MILCFRLLPFSILASFFISSSLSDFGIRGQHYVYTTFLHKKLNSAREPCQVSRCLEGCQQIKRLIKSFEEKSCLFVSDRKPFHSQSEYSISYHDTSFYIFIRQAKLFCSYCVTEDVGIQKPFFYCYFPVVRSHCIVLQYKYMLTINSRPHGC